MAQRSPLTERGNRYGATRKASERLMSNQFAHNVAFQFGGGRCLPSDLIKTVFARRPLRPSATGRVGEREEGIGVGEGGCRRSQRRWRQISLDGEKALWEW